MENESIIDEEKHVALDMATTLCINERIGANEILFYAKTFHRFLVDSKVDLTTP